MRDDKIYLLTALFVCLGAVKHSFPEQSAQLRARADWLLSHEAGYTEVLQTMGRSLGRGQFREELVQVLGRLWQPETEELVTALWADPPEPEPTGSPPSAQPETEAPQPEAVAAFLAREAAFPGYEIPENVRTDMPALPFAYGYPVDAEESSGFGHRQHPLEGEIRFHYGTDFAADAGDPVYAFADGYVYQSGTSDGYGNYYILTHEGGYASIYAHLSKQLVPEGTMVKCGQRIGCVGQSGRTTGPHLHFELLLDDVYLNPEYYL